MTISIYFPKINKSYTSKNHKFTNIIRAHYTNSEEAYHDVYRITEKPKCKICANDAKYLSFSKGYSKTCNNKECSKKNNGIITIERLKNGDIEFYQHILKNHEEYVKIYLNNEAYFDRYLNKVIKNDVRRFITSKIPNEKLTIIRKCIVTGKEYESDLLPKNMYDLIVSNSKSLVNLKSKFKYKEIVHIMRLFNNFDEPNNVNELKNIPNIHAFYRFIDKSKVKILKLKDKKSFTRKGFEFEFNGKIYTSFNHRFKNSNKRNLNLYVPHDELDKLFDIYRTCLICNKKYDHYKIIYDLDNHNVIKKQTKGKYTCSRNCYHNLLKDKKIYYEYDQNARKKQSTKLKEKIIKGEFTPNSTNSWCKSRIESRDGTKHFRSTWEAVYWAYNKNLLYETVRVPYMWNGEKHIYIVDFENKESKIIYEIKPKNQIRAKEEEKIKSAMNWAKDNGYLFKIINEDWFLTNIKSESIQYILEYISIDETTLIKRMKQFLNN